MLIGLFLTLLAIGSDLPWHIDIFVNNKTILFLIIILWLIITIMHAIYESDLNIDIDSFDKINNIVDLWNDLIKNDNISFLNMRL